MSDEDSKPPKSFYAIAVVALLWNLIGLSVYVMTMTITPEVLAELPEGQRDFITSTPAWANAAFAIAVNAGALGCVFLLLRKTWAYPAFIVSLAGVLVQQIYGFLLSNGLEVYGTAGLLQPLSVIIVGGFLIKYSKDASDKGWIS